MAIAIFTTWTTYGTWLPGDDRGWYEAYLGLKVPDPDRKFEAALKMNDSAVVLDDEQRRRVEETIVRHCEIRGWTLHAVQSRSNHVHVVVTAPGRDIEIPREQFKAWTNKTLKAIAVERRIISVRIDWWTERGWDVYVDDERHLAEVIAYTLERQ